MIGSSPLANDSCSLPDFDARYFLSVLETEFSQSCSTSFPHSQVYNSLNTSDAGIINLISNYINGKTGKDFVGTWAMHTEWTDMCVSPTSSQVSILLVHLRKVFLLINFLDRYFVCNKIHKL